MKTNIRSHGNFKLDLFVLILLFLLLGVSISKGQSDLQQGIDIFNQKNYYGAKRFFNDYIKANMESAEAYYYLGRIAMEEKELRQATQYFEEAVSLEDDNAEFQTWKGVANIQMLSTVDFMEQGVYAQKALHALETAVYLDPNKIDARMWLGGYYANAPDFAGGSKENAMEQYEAIKKIDPSFVPAYVDYGVVLMRFEEYDLAFENLNASLEIMPDNYEVFLLIGNLSAESSRFAKEGEHFLKKFIDNAPEQFQDKMGEAWWYMGTIYLNEGDTGNARKAYEKAVDLDPDKEEYMKSLKKLM